MRRYGAEMSHSEYVRHGGSFDACWYGSGLATVGGRGLMGLIMCRVTLSVEKVAIGTAADLEVSAAVGSFRPTNHAELVAATDPDACFQRRS